jgi:hypothetical protein
MDLEKLEKAKELQSQIGFLKNKIKSFNPENKYVYLNITDHYGNKRDVIETYAFSDKYSEAAGYGFNQFVANSYGEFLEKVQTELQKRIDILQLELDNL